MMQQQQPMGYGMQPQMMQQQMPMQGQGAVYSNAGHQMQWINYCPYPGAEGADCDGCNQPINIPAGFYHCQYTESDLCPNCGAMRRR